MAFVSSEDQKATIGIDMPSFSSFSESQRHSHMPDPTRPSERP
jgi:hypothetical protein